MSDTPWEVALFRASVVPTSLVGAVAVAVGGAVRGVDGALGALVGAVLVVGTFGLGLWVASRTRVLHPLLTMSAALMSYLFTITALLLVLVLVRRTGAVDREAVGGSVLVCVLVWIAAQVRGFTRLQLLNADPSLVPEPPAAPDVADGTDPG